MAVLPVVVAQAQPADANYDEAKVDSYTLPDPLVLSSGERVKDVATWEKRRRPEILRLFEQHVYGRNPGKPKGMTFELKSIEKKALGGTAVRKEVTVLFNGRNDGPKMDILMYLPAEARGPIPLFLGLNFGGNHAVHKDPGISVTKSWVRNNRELGIENNQATERTRGSEASRWQVEKVLARGYGL